MPIRAALQPWDWGQPSWLSMGRTLEVIQYNFPLRQESVQEHCSNVSRVKDCFLELSLSAHVANESLINVSSNQSGYQGAERVAPRGKVTTWPFSTLPA